MLKIKIKNISSQLDGFIPTTEVWNELYETLAYPIQGAEYSEKVMEGKWDGIKRLFDRKHKTFFTGLISIVLDIFERHRVPYELEDLRERPRVSQTFKLHTGKKPRPYQLESVQKKLIYGRGVIQAPTGAGKSFMIAMLLARLGLPAMVYVNTCDLLYQMIEDLQTIDIDPKNIGQIGDGIVNPQLFTVATIQSVYTAFDLKYPKFDEEDTLTEKISDDKKTIVINAVRQASVIVMDETQFLAADTFQVVATNSVNAYYRYGLSVGGDSRVTVFHKGKIEILPLKELFERTDKKINEFRSLPNYMVRSFDGQKFVWKKIKGILKHKTDSKKLFRIYTEKGRTLTVTEDHSIYVVKKAGYNWIHNKKKYIGAIEESKGADLKIGDYLLLEDKTDNPTQEIVEFDLLDYIDSSGIRVVGDFSDWIRKEYNYKRAWSLCRKPNQTLSLSEFRRSGLEKNRISYIYGKTKKLHSPTKLKTKDIVYLIGFFAGDGWIDENRIGFAVETEQVAEFKNRLKELQKTIQFNFSERKMPGRSSEIKIASVVLRDFFAKLYQRAKAPFKKIPQEIFMLNKSDIRLFLDGMRDSDGCLPKRERNAKSWSYTTTSEELALDLLELLKSIGVVAGISKTEPKKGGIINGRQIVGKHAKYDVYVSGHWIEGNNQGHHGRQNHFDMLGVEGYPARIKKIEETYQEYVYDISVDSEDWQSFVASDILVHNSATPWRSDNADLMLNAATGKKIFSISISELIQKKYLVPPDITIVNLPREQKNFAGTSFQTIYKQKVTENETSNNIIAEIAHFFNKKTMTVLILVQHIAHGEILINKLKTLIDTTTVDEYKFGRVTRKIKNIELLKGDVISDKRKKIISLFREKKIEILIATSLADCGLNIPSLDALILAGRGKSITRAPQRVGRVIRTAPGKTRAYVFDFYDPAKYLNMHASERIEIYKSEPEFRIHDLKIDRKTNLQQYLTNLILPLNVELQTNM